MTSLLFGYIFYVCMLLSLIKFISVPLLDEVLFQFEGF